MKAEEMIKFWMEGAEDAWETAEQLFEGKKYHFALFFCHLALEKYLKGLVIKKIKKAPPFTPNLVNLFRAAGMKLTLERVEDLVEISKFNVEARYPKVKQELYNKATREFTIEWMDKVKEYRKWILEQY